MITLQGQIEVYDVNPKRVKITILKPLNIGTDPANEGHIILTADESRESFPDAFTGQKVNITVE